MGGYIADNPRALAKRTRRGERPAPLTILRTTGDGSHSSMKKTIKPQILATAVMAVLALATTQVAAQYVGNASPVGIPMIHLKDGSTQNQGKAFAIQWFHSRKLLLMPLHLLGPGAGYPVYIEAQNVPDLVTSIDVLNLDGNGVVVTAGPGLLRAGRKIHGQYLRRSYGL